MYEGKKLVGEVESDYRSALTSEIRVVTFDLDNTIWKTSNVIQTANDALANYIDSHGIQIPTRIENIMGQLFKQDKARYCPVLGKDNNGNDEKKSLEEAKAPVLLSQLRKDAVKHALLENETGLDEIQAQTFADEAFQVWTDARHKAIPANFAKSVLTCLRGIRALQTSDGQSIIVGAVTDGNSDPRKVDALAEFFDFCINAESVGVSKPDVRIYNAAIMQVVSKPQVHDIFGDLDLNDLSSSIDLVQDRIGPWWVHIGDDFVKDVVAAKDIKMRSIWCRELINIPSPPPAPKIQNALGDESNLIKAISENKVLEMTIGSDDFLLDSIQNEFADAIVDNFIDLLSVLQQWQQDSAKSKPQSPSED